MLPTDPLQQAIDEIRAASLFGLLSDKQLNVLLEHLSIKQYAFGERILTQGQPANTLLIVLKGAIRQTIATEGKDMIIGRVTRGRSVNLRAVLVDKVDGFSVIADEDCEIIQVPAQPFLDVLEATPSLKRYLERLNTERSLQKFKNLLQANDVPFHVVRELIAAIQLAETYPGQIIVGQGSNPAAFFIVRSGRCRRSVGLSADEERFLGFIEEGQFFGTECLLDNLPSPHQIMADEETTLFALPPEAFRRYIIDAPMLLNLFPKDGAVTVTRRVPSATPSEPERLNAFLAQGSEALEGKLDSSRLAEGVADRLDKLISLSEPEEAEEAAPPQQPKRRRKAPSPGKRKKARKKSAQQTFSEFQSKKKRYVHLQQHDEMDCGAACLAMIAKYHGMDLGIPYFREAAYVSRDGTSLLALANAAEKAGFTTRGVRLTAEALANVTLPAVAHFGYHFVVFYAVDAKGVMVADPAKTLHRMSFEELAQKWTGILLLLEPTPRLYSHDPQKNNYRRYAAIARPHLSIIRDILVASLLLSLLGLGMPIFNQLILDKVLVHQNLELLNLIIMGMVIATVFDLIVGAVRTYLVDFVSMKLDISLSTFFYRHVLRLPMKFFTDHRVGDITSRLGEVEGIRSFLTHGAVGTILDAIMLVVYVAILTYYDWRLLFLALAFTAPIMVLTRFVSPRLQATYLEVAEQHAIATSQMVEQISAMATIKALGAEDLARWRWQKTFEKTTRMSFSLQKLGLLYSTFGQAMMTCGNLTIMYLGARMVLEGKLSAGQLIGISSIFGQVMHPILNLTSQWNEIQELKVRLQRLNDVFDHPPETGPTRSSLKSQNLKGHIRIENLSFGYKGPTGPMVLKGLSMEIYPGQMVAIVGRSGSGKTTLAQLINRLQEPLGGKIVFDGFEAKEIPLPLLRQHVGIVLQDNALFSGSILENIAYGDDDPDLSRVVNAATLANAHEFITRLPMGYSTKLTEGGLGLSGGQKQRIAIARSLYHDPKVLLMDEATSALDAESEQAILSNFKSIIQGRTAIIIAHRLNTIMQADQVFVLDEGSIIEAGTHKSLMAKRGLYYSLFSQQLNL